MTVSLRLANYLLEQLKTVVVNLLVICEELSDSLHSALKVIIIPLSMWVAYVFYRLFGQDAFVGGRH